MAAQASLVLYLHLLATVVLLPRGASCPHDSLSSQAILAANTALVRAFQASDTATLSLVISTGSRRAFAGISSRPASHSRRSHL